jgi:hypothetical protein
MLAEAEDSKERMWMCMWRRRVRGRVSGGEGYRAKGQEKDALVPLDGRRGGGGGGGGDARRLAGTAASPGTAEA